jgi:imidazolonepropionase
VACHQQECVYDDVGRIVPGGRADAAILDAPSYTHLVYRPAVPLVASTLMAGRIESADA